MYQPDELSKEDAKASEQSKISDKPLAEDENDRRVETQAAVNRVVNTSKDPVEIIGLKIEVPLERQEKGLSVLEKIRSDPKYTNSKDVAVPTRNVLFPSFAIAFLQCLNWRVYLH